jgi:hypothetical protein
MLVSNTMPSIQPTASWPASWSDAGTQALVAVQRIEGEIAAIVARKPPPLSEPERQQLMRLGADLELLVASGRDSRNT